MDMQGTKRMAKQTSMHLAPPSEHGIKPCPREAAVVNNHEIVRNAVCMYNLTLQLISSLGHYQAQGRELNRACTYQATALRDLSS